MEYHHSVIVDGGGIVKSGQRCGIGSQSIPLVGSRIDYYRMILDGTVLSGGSVKTAHILSGQRHYYTQPEHNKLAVPCGFSIGRHLLYPYCTLRLAGSEHNLPVPFVLQGIVIGRKQYGIRRLFGQMRPGVLGLGFPLLGICHYGKLQSLVLGTVEYNRRIAYLDGVVFDLLIGVCTCGGKQYCRSDPEDFFIGLIMLFSTNY